MKLLRRLDGSGGRLPRAVDPRIGGKTLAEWGKALNTEEKLWNDGTEGGDREN